MGDGGQHANFQLHSESAQPAQWVALVVEDDDDQRDLIGAILEESDVMVITCQSAEAAMQVMDGVDLARELGERWPHTRVVTTSGGCDRKRLAKLPKRTRHLEKPWRALDLIIELERAIAAH
jgi:CheY-like chemotaxis protein